MLRPRFNPRERNAVIIVFLIGVAWAAIILRVQNRYRHNAGAEEGLIAKHLALGHGFLSPMNPTPLAEPTSWSPPVYPYVVAAASRLFGIETIQTAIALGVVNAISFGIVAVSAMQIAMVADAERSYAPQVLLGASRLSGVPTSSFAPRTAGIIAVAVLCAHPIVMRFVFDYWDGELALAIFMLTMALAASWGRSRLGPARSAILGAMLGLLALTNAAYALAYPVILFFACRRVPLREKWKSIAIAVLMFAATLAPWTVRNYQEFGRLMYVRGGAQLELWNGNRPESSGWLSPRTMVKHPYRNDEERALLLQLGEMQYFDLCGKRFRDDLTADPRTFVSRTLRRIAWLFFGDPGMRGWIPIPMRWGLFGMDVEHLVLAATTALGVLAAFIGRQRAAARWILSIAVLTVVPFFITSTADRYALPLRTLLCVLSGIVIASLISRWRFAANPPTAA